MAMCRHCGESHMDFLEKRSGLCPACFEAKSRGKLSASSGKGVDGNCQSPHGMPLLRTIAVAAFCLAALGVIAGAAQEELNVVLASVMVALAGVLFLALDRIVTALEAIRDRIAPATPVESTHVSGTSSESADQA